MTPEALFNEQRPDVLFEEGGAVLLRRKRHGRKQKRTDAPGQHQRILSMLMVPRDSGAVDKQGRRCRPASRSPGSARVASPQGSYSGSEGEILSEDISTVVGRARCGNRLLVTRNAVVPIWTTAGTSLLRMAEPDTR